MPQSTDQLETDVADLMAEAHRLGKRIAAGESIPDDEMGAYYARRAELDERLDDRHRERLQ